MKYFKIEIGDDKRRERESGEEGGWADHLGSERNDRAIIDLAPGNPTHPEWKYSRPFHFRRVFSLKTSWTAKRIKTFVSVERVFDS